ncbi:YqiA/YcfP family alpha/beta fold hydrolase [Hydrogenimonas sp. SS33]|uniref:YqiA/YcfP family alpha/beta fold hydrolase n=1 Tax=Hydrogenimonas leucolamina TaxID=2954236 RepID=UPI00336BF288
MVLYIHGFASSGLGAKARIVRDYFGERAFAPSLSHIPELAVDTLRQIVGRTIVHEPVRLIGSSLGGFYATVLAETYNLKAVIVNPSTRPWVTLGAHIGMVTHFHDLSRFEWTRQHITTLKSLNPETIHPKNYLLMLQTGDDLLDYRIALRRYEGAQTILEEGGSHAFEGFERHLKSIEEFLG